MSKNTITIKQLEILCHHVDELIAAGFTENYAIRLLELSTDVYAKDLIMGNTNPYHASRIPQPQWSKAALEAKKEHPEWKDGSYLRVEHGTPKREFARRIREEFQQGKLTKCWVDEFCQKMWKIAVITHDEDTRLNRSARSRMFESPEKRWEEANIKF